MGLNKAEVKLRRLLASMPNQQNSRKLVHYVATARELLNVLTGESAQQNLPSISVEKAREYVERIEAFAEKLNINDMPDIWDAMRDADDGLDAEHLNEEDFKREELLRPQEDTKKVESSSSPILRRRRQPHVPTQPLERPSSVVKLDGATQEFIGRHKRLQDDLTDEMVVLARNMKESTLLMERSLQDTEKILDSTEHAIEHSLASTNRATQRAGEIYSQSFKTGCLTWLLIFAIFCMFIFMIAVIRVT